MRIVFATDATLHFDEGTNDYYHQVFNQSLWMRYLAHFQALTICCRATPAAERFPPSMASGNGSLVRICSIPNVSRVRHWRTDRKQARERLTEAIQHADAVIVRLPSVIGLMAVRIARRMGKPWAVEVVGHAWDAYWHHGSLAGKAAAPLITARMKKTIRAATFALYVTESYLQQLYPSQGVTCACSDVELHWDEQAGVRRIARLKSHREKTVFGLIGSMKVNHKGIDTAIHAIHRLRKRGWQVELRILGGGSPDRFQRLAQRLGCADAIHFDGVLPSGAAVAAWLDQLDLYLQPSRLEGLPRALIEAMNSGLPALASRTGGIPELLDDACLVKPGDPEGLTAGMDAFLQRSDLMERQIVRNHEWASRYDLERLKEKRRAFWSAFRDAVTGGRA